MNQPIPLWAGRPVYSAQCYTFNVARRLCGEPAAPGTGRVSVFGSPGGHPLGTFRALAPYRSPAARRLRAEVAALVRCERAIARLRP